ncbi:MAG TPA: hypothetical protein VFR02_00325, partial [bacterium]|nr:hypothetical protein [bacterium]
GGGMYWEGSLFAGVTGMTLALFGLFASRAPRRLTAAGLGLFLLLLAMGKRTPLFMVFYHAVPFFGDFRGAAKLNILVSLWVCYLAAAGLDHYLGQEGPVRRLVRWAGGFALGVSALAAFFHFAPALGWGRLYGKFGAHAPGMVESLLLCGLTLGAAALAAWAGKRFPRWRLSLLGLAFLELLLFARANRGGFDLPALQAKAAAIQAVYDQDPGDYRVTAEPSNITLGTSGFDVWGNDPMIPGRYALFLAESQHLDVGDHFVDKPFFRSYPPALGLTRLRYVFEQDGEGWRVRRLALREQPRALLVGGWREEQGETAVQTLLRPGFNPRREALVESDPGFPSRPGPGKGSVRLRDLSTDALEVRADNEGPCLLVVGDNDAPGWRAVAAPDDPGSYRVVPVNFFQRGVPLAPGSHHFTLEYRPPFLTAAAWVSAVSLCLTLAGAAVGWRRRALLPYDESQSLRKP